MQINHLPAHFSTKSDTTRIGKAVLQDWVSHMANITTQSSCSYQSSFQI